MLIHIFTLYSDSFQLLLQCCGRKNICHSVNTLFVILHYSLSVLQVALNLLYIYTQLSVQLWSYRHILLKSRHNCYANKVHNHMRNLFHIYSAAPFMEEHLLIRRGSVKRNSVRSYFVLIQPCVH